MMPRVVLRGTPGLDSMSDELQHAPKLPETKAGKREDSSVIERLGDNDFIRELFCSEMCYRSSWTV